VTDTTKNENTFGVFVVAPTFQSLSMISPYLGVAGPRICGDVELSIKMRMKK
jgi:hypothetical protein